MKNDILKFKMFNLFTFFFVILLFTFYIFHLPEPVFAQTPTPSSLPPTTYHLPPTTYPTSPYFTDLLVYNMFHTFSCLAVGGSVIGQPCLTYQITQNAQGAIQSVPVLSSVNLSGGVLGTTSSLIGLLYTNPPVRTADYLASLGQGFGIVRQANAQVGGSGAQVLSPIISLWQVSRNIAYLIMIIIFVIIGLMVMFRQRINPQTVITAQAALPGLVIGLILITFSYFLAGLVSDTAFVGTNLVGAYFSAVRGETNNPQNLVDDIKDKNVLKLFTPFTKIINQGRVESALSSIWNDLVDPNTNRLNPFDLDPQKVLTNLAMLIVTQLVLPFGGLFGGPGQIISGGAALTLTGLATTFVVSIAISFIAMIILIYAMFRLLLRLINNYISIIFLTITAPFQFLAATLPGRQGIATRWILGMLANVLAFPAVLAVFYFVAFILGSTTLDQYCPKATCPFKISQESQMEHNAFIVRADDTTVVGKKTFPLFGGMATNFINLLLAFGALVALPKIPDLVAKAVGGLSETGQLIGQEIGGSVAQGRGYAGQFQQGTSGLAGQAGRLTNAEEYGIIGFDQKGNPQYGISLYASRAGQIAKGIFNVKRFFGKEGKPD